MIFQNEEEQQKEYEAIVGKRHSILSDDLEREYQKYRDAHTMASDSNATLHKAMQLHLGNLKMLSLPLSELQGMIPSMTDIDEESEASITEVKSSFLMIYKQNFYFNQCISFIIDFKVIFYAYSNLMVSESLKSTTK